MVDCYPPIAPELLLLVSGLKQIFAFGLAYGIVPWVEKENYAIASVEIVAIHVGIFLLGVPLWYYGPRIRHVFSSWKVIMW